MDTQYEQFIKEIPSLALRAILREEVSDFDFTDHGELQLCVELEPMRALLRKPDRNIHLQKCAQKVYGESARVCIMSQADLDYDKQFKAARKLLPAWFIPRMMYDTWLFGLLTTQGIILGVERIRHVHQAADGDIWLDVDLLEGARHERETWGNRLLCAPTSRTQASVNARHIVAAFELADT